MLHDERSAFVPIFTWRDQAEFLPKNANIRIVCGFLSVIVAEQVNLIVMVGQIIPLEFPIIPGTWILQERKGSREFEI